MVIRLPFRRESEKVGPCWGKNLQKVVRNYVCTSGSPRLCQYAWWIGSRRLQTCRTGHYGHPEKASLQQPPACPFHKPGGQSSTVITAIDSSFLCILLPLGRLHRPLRARREVCPRGHKGCSRQTSRFSPSNRVLLPVVVKMPGRKTGGACPVGKQTQAWSARQAFCRAFLAEIA
jgi:hypothetical protein